MTASTGKTLVTNRRASHEYSLGERFEAGLALTGTEVKSIRAGKINITDGWVDVDGWDAYLRDVHVSPYSHGNIMNHTEKRPRRLLLTRRELARLAEASQQRGFSIIPTRVYLKRSWIKVEIALARGKKLHDKRESVKAREADREMARSMKR